MATVWALPSILVSVPHQPEKPPTLSASATLWLAASSTCSGLLEASAGLASARSPSRKAFCAAFSSSHGVSKQPVRARDGMPSRIERRKAIMVFRTLRRAQGKPRAHRPERSRRVRLAHTLAPLPRQGERVGEGGSAARATPPPPPPPPR